MSKNSKKEKIDKVKEKYKVSNWSAYNNSLKNRGKLSIWLSEDIEAGWFYSGTRLPGGEVVYSDTAIEFCLTIKHLFGLAYRQTEGFIEDMFTLLQIDLPVPSYSQMQRRSKKIKVDIRVRNHSKQDIDLVIDSTGLKVYGEGEWKVRKHGWSKRRTWRKLHMGSDGSDLEILSVDLTGNDVDDAQAGIKIVSGIKETVQSVAGDGAYDKKKFRKSVPKDVKQLIPPQHNAVESKNKEPALRQRDEAISQINQIGRKQWKEKTGYHIRSKSEVNMFRYKVIFGGQMSARKSDFEETEVKIKCKILNQFVELGMPKSYKVAS